jgi:hypothetical protein
MSDQASTPDRRKLVELVTLENPIEATALTALLQDRGIASNIDSWHSSPFDGLFEAQKGHAKLLVFEEDLERARQVLEDFKRSLADEAPANEDEEPQR